MLLNNILKMLMCYAFQSLPSMAMEKFIDLENDTIGLNVLPLLFDGLSVGTFTKAEIAGSKALYMRITGYSYPESQASLNSATRGDVEVTCRALQAPHSLSSKVKNQLSTVEKQDMQKSSHININLTKITPEELDDMVVSTDSVPADDVIDSHEFQEILNSVDIVYATDASDEDENEDSKSKLRTLQSWAHGTDTTRQSLLIGRHYHGHTRPSENVFIINHSHFIIYFKCQDLDQKQGYMVTL